MAKDKAYYEAVKKIEEARLSKELNLDLRKMGLTELPDSFEELKNLQTLNLSFNQLEVLPKSFWKLTNLRSLNLSENYFSVIPDSVEELARLQNLNLSRNQLRVLSDSMGKLTELQELDLSDCPVQEVPVVIRKLRKLRSLTISRCNLKSIPSWLGELTELQTLRLSGSPPLLDYESPNAQFYYYDYYQQQAMLLGDNDIRDLPASLAQLENLTELDLANNPLNTELRVAYDQGLSGVKAYLRAKLLGGQITLNEAKLILIGEGEVGKTSLLYALRGDIWIEKLPTTHGIQIKPVQLIIPKTKSTITLNGWDFGGQPIYRPTHQLFFSAPAIYLVVWKPREGPQQGFVKEWIQLVKRREPSAKIIVVATHGGPNQRQPDIDRQELWDMFGKETVVRFFFVDSKPDENGKRKGIEKLKWAIARIAATLPEVGRSVPRSFADVRQALHEKGVPYLPLQEVLQICRAHNMDDEIAKLFITISHRLGHLTHYENDPILRDLVILRPDWLATAMSYVFDDEETRNMHGLVNFSRLSYLWNNPTRPAEDRYPDFLHSIFLRLMERFDLSYRVADPDSKAEADPISLIGQLVPDVRPANYANAWGTSPVAGDIQQTQICRIVDATNGQSANAEGLFYQLIVRLHKYSLGRVDYKESVHWQRGLVLEDEYRSRAFLEHIGTDIRITVRSPFPEGLLSTLTREVKYLVERFWKGLRCDVMVPCIEPCGKNAPGTGLFNVTSLMESKREGEPKYPCPVCNKWQNIDSLLRNAPAATKSISLADLQSEFESLRDEIKGELHANTRRVLSQINKTYTDLLQVLSDEAKEGPRLFSFFPVDRSNFSPKEWIRAKFRLVLWCEHSRLPLPVLNDGDMRKGVYDLELDREWFKKSAPYLKFLTGTLGMVLPVASSSIKLALDESAYKLIEEQLDFSKSVIDAAIGETAKIGDFLGSAETTKLEHGVATRADGSTLRELHALLKAKDPSFGGLVRVMNKRQEFLWVHERFASEY